MDVITKLIHVSKISVCIYIYTYIYIYMYASVNYAIIGSDNGLPPVWHHTIIWINTGLSFIVPLRRNYNEIHIKIWVRSRNCVSLVTWFCYELIAKPGNKTASVLWPDPYEDFQWRKGIWKCHLQNSGHFSLPQCADAHIPVMLWHTHPLYITGSRLQQANPGCRPPLAAIDVFQSTHPAFMCNVTYCSRLRLMINIE